jgi:hypothetical protein
VNVERADSFPDRCDRAAARIGVRVDVTADGDDRRIRDDVVQLVRSGA